MAWHRAVISFCGIQHREEKYHHHQRHVGEKSASMTTTSLLGCIARAFGMVSLLERWTVIALRKECERDCERECGRDCECNCGCVSVAFEVEGEEDG